jgi:FkbM family methyltransferase
LQDSVSTQAAAVNADGQPRGLEAPSLAAGRSDPAGATDAVGLLRIVRAQAEDLVRLRRELTSVRARLRPRSAPRAPALPVDTGGLRDLGHDELVAKLRVAQDEISAVLFHSRWLKLGRRLGLARPTDWEGRAWQSPYATGTSQAEVPAAVLRGEVLRLARLQEELSRSRWRQIGHRLRVSRPMSWDRPAGAAARAAAEAAPDDVAADSAPAAASEPLTERFLAECKAGAVDSILDIGANTGQFARSLRAAGWIGHIVSFEPLSVAHAALSAAARLDALWDVAARCAIGAAEGRAEINVAGNSWSSSLLPMADAHVAAAPSSAYTGTETCEVVTLDAAIERIFSDPTTLFALKIDTQGYEKQVLQGLQRHRAAVRVVLCELSLDELYEGAPSILEMFSVLHAAGFRCVGLSPALIDPKTGRLLQVDGLFIKRQGLA